MKHSLRSILKDFLQHVADLETRKKLNDDQYEVEFQRLKQLSDRLRGNPEYSCSHGHKETNRPKNRYKDIVPYDFSRVILPEFTQTQCSDYINASHIKGASGAMAYIAAQGPLPNTVMDFWRMIWTCDVQVIVMACNEFEGGKRKCEIYWPLEIGVVKKFGTVSVRLIKQTQVCADFLVRTLHVSEENESREIWQFHYSTWPDHGIPDSVQPILQLVHFIRECQASETAPIVVHCSAGCGRTGTLCAIDFIWACLRTGKLTENFSLYDVVAEMRRQRIAMVQTKEQYVLVHKAVSAMFEQQLRLIDNHTYENLNFDGSPLLWNSEIENNLRCADLLKPSDDSKDVENANFMKQDGHENEPDKVGQSICSPANSIETISDNRISAASASQQPKDEIEKNSVKCKENVSLPPSSNSASLILSCSSSIESIPFIDDDDTKSEIQVRARCGRAYLHIPSYDSISKIVDKFDPFVDKVWTDSQPSMSFTNAIEFHAKLKTIDDSVNSSITTLPTADKSSSEMKQQICLKNDIDLVEKDKTFTRRSSISKLKGIFDKSRRSDKSSLFRHHSHHVSRAGSAPPSLNSMKRSSDTEKESIFALITRKFRSSSVKSEEELLKENPVSSPPPPSPHSYFAVMKKTAANSFSHLKQNLSILAKVPFSKRSVKQSSERASNESSSSAKSSSKIETGDENGNPDKSSESHIDKEVNIFSNTDGNESIHQKFVVNVLSSGHSVVDGVVIPNDSAKPGSQKSRNFLQDFECLNPIRMVTNNSSNKSNQVSEATSLWYCDENGNQNLNKGTDSDKTLKEVEKPSDISKFTGEQNVNSNDSKISQSVFYANFDPNDTLDPKFQVKPEEDNGIKIGSSCFWPSRPTVLTEDKPSVKHIESEKTESKVPIVPPKIGAKPLIISHVSQDVHPKDKLLNNLDLSIKKEDKNKVLEDPISVEQNDVKQVPRENTSEMQAASSDEPPALPRKVAIGKNKYINQYLHSFEVSERSIKREDLPVPTKAELKPVNEPQQPGTILPSASGAVADDIYINVNPVAQMNLEQIESTLRNHPRGAIIDLTSRQSYSMEEDLNRAVLKLAEPAKLNQTVVPLNKKYPGYEVIWPETSTDIISDENKPKLVLDDDKIPAYTNETLDMVFQDNSSLTKRTGLCESPPLRRSSGGSSSSLLKSSSSSSSLNWRQEEDPAAFVENTEKSKVSPADELVNEAVVELSSMLNELTSKTFSDDINQLLDLPGNEKTTDCNFGDKNNQLPSALDEIPSKPHTYETLYLPQNQTLSLKHGQDEEIIFCFPPPPPLPPPPLDTVSESFSVLCKDGNFKLLGNEAKRVTDKNTELKTPALMAAVENVAVPMPLPRKQKQSEIKPPRSLVKSVSCTALLPDIVSDLNEARLRQYPEQKLVGDSVEPSAKIVDLSVRKRDKFSNISTSGSKGKSPDRIKARYETIFPQEETPKHSPKRRQAKEHPVGDLPSDCCPFTIPPKEHFGSSKLKSEFAENMPVRSSSFRKAQREHLKQVELVGLSQQLSDVLASSDSKATRKTPEAFESFKEQLLEVSKHQHKKSSHKSERAPLPPSMKHSTNPLANIEMDRHSTKRVSRKSEKAPEPPRDRTLLTGASSGQSNDPQYAVVRKQKLSLVLENLCDTESASSIDDQAVLFEKEFRARANKSLGSSLQHSHSDASVFLNLRTEKFHRKHLHTTVPSVVANKESDSFVGNYGDKYFHKNFSDEQKLRNQGPQKPLPVAPPRSKKKNAEVGQAQGNLGASVESLSRCDPPNETLPNVPIKTKETFEVPEKFRVNKMKKADSLSRTSRKDE